MTITMTEIGLTVQEQITMTMTEANLKLKVTVAMTGTSLGDCQQPSDRQPLEGMPGVRVKTSIDDMG